MFFAEEFPTAPIVPAQAVTIVIVLWTVITIVGVVIGTIALIVSMRRKPAIESEFATKAELNALRAELSAHTSAIFAKIESMNVSMNSEFSGLNRSLGKLEGQRDLVHSMVEAIRSK